MRYAAAMQRAMWSALALAVALAAPGARAATVADLDAAQAMTWLVKSVCADAQDRVLPVDPYRGCPPGARIRKLRPGDPLPYHNIEQRGYQQRDAFPVFDPVTGQTRIVATFDYAPFGRFNLFDGTDGYDVIALGSHWAAILGTSDGGGYGQTFYGANCTQGDGWVLFPAEGFARGGRATMAIRDVYWEQSGQSYPGACPADYSTNTETAWELMPRFRFGGVEGHPVKTMQALVSYHGFRPTAGFLRRGHLEVFYFTREYGLTRWEVWTPAGQHPRQTAECALPPAPIYRGVRFVVQDCHDWSVASPAAEPDIPVWPIPQVNLLRQAHFDGDVRQSWRVAGGLRVAAANSTASRDTASAPQGVRYLRIGCSGGCAGDAAALYQDVPIGSLKSGSYAFAVSVRSGDAAEGRIAVALQQIDAAGHVLSSARASATVASDNGRSPSRGEAQSAYLATAFVAGRARIAIDPRAIALRLLIAPQTPGNFDLLDAWLAPWPAPTAGFGAPSAR